MNDVEILIECRGRLRHLSRADAVNRVAETYGLTRSGVSGQLSRAEQNADAMLELTNFFASKAEPSKAERRVQKIIDLSKEILKPWPDEDYTAVFLSDIHYPEQDKTALKLFLRVVRDVPNVRYISALNDALDFAKLSQWPERRRISKQQLDDDFSYTLDIYEQWLKTLKLACPVAQHVALTGNHDARAARFGVLDGAAEVSQAYSMERLFAMGVLFLEPLYIENTFSPARGTLWAHGYKAGQNLKTVAKQAYEHFKWTEKIPHDYTLVTGHVHRSGDFQMDSGGRSIISGCFHQPHPHYLKNAPHWDHAFVVTQVASGKVYHDLVRFEFDETGLFCRYNGKVYRP